LYPKKILTGLDWEEKRDSIKSFWERSLFGFSHEKKERNFFGLDFSKFI